MSMSAKINRGVLFLSVLAAITQGRGEDHIKNRPDRIQWHEAARFGAIVHFSPDTIGKIYHYDRAKEADPYRGRPIPPEEFDRYYTQLTLENFDADAWVETMADAGMKYFVFVAKHHNGFCLFNSKYTNYDIYAVSGRDMVEELAEACEKYGIKLCLYYSIMDWYHPHATGDSHGGKGVELPPGVEPDLEIYIKYMNAQLKELTTNYGSVHLMWYDGAWMSRWTKNPKLKWTRKHAHDLYNYTLTLQPGIMCNNRMLNEHYHFVDNLGDYYTPELFIGNFDRSNQWESVVKLGESWHWVPNEPIKSRGEVLKELTRCAGHDGNYLLNIGPDPSGMMEPGQVTRLKEIGDWLKTNGEAVYGTRGGPYLSSENIVSTCVGDKVYLHVYNLTPKNTTVSVPVLDAKVLSCELMDQTKVGFKVKDNQVKIKVPAGKLDADVTVIQLTLDRNAFDLKLVQIDDAVDHGIDTTQKVEQENL